MSIALLGYGLIGRTIEHFLRQSNYYVEVWDAQPSSPHVREASFEDHDMLVKILRDKHVVIAATPYHLNKNIARAAIECNTNYFDLTEDVSVTDDIIHELSPLAKKSILIPQCGLAPGAVGIIANQLVRGFSEIYDVKLRVGALPRTTSNHMKYYMSWSPEGLVNEYYNECPAIKNYNQVMLDPLEGLETLCFDGVEYEAFNTSGGIGSLVEQLSMSSIPVANANYKTIRYKGHRDNILFLKDDLGLLKEDVVQIFKREVPQNEDDVVVIFVEVVGEYEGKLKRKAYFHKIYGFDGFSAIQVTTAAGVVAAMDCLFNQRGVFENIKKGYFPIDTLEWNDFVNAKYGNVFHNGTTI